MNNDDLQSLMLLMSPPEGEHLRTYLASAATALGGRGDAALARTIGVAPSSLANWKRRGVVPQDYHVWFTTTLIEKIGAYSSGDAPKSSLEAREAVVRFLQLPSATEIQETPTSAAKALGGLVTLAQFLCDRSEAIEGETADPERVAQMLVSAMTFFMRAEQYR